MSRASSNVSRKLLREFLTLNRRLPADQAQQNVDLFRKRAKDLRNATDAAAESEALKELVAKVSFLRIMVPRRAGDKSITAATYIVRDGKLVEGEAERPGLRVASSQVSMAEYRARHQELLQRQHFGRAPPPYDPSTF